MDFRAKQWVLGVTAAIAIVTVAACGNRPAAGVRPTLLSPNAIPQKTRNLPSPVPRLTSLPSPVLPTPHANGAATVSTATIAAPTVARPTATARPASFSMPGASDTTPATPVPPQHYDAAQTVVQYAADVLGAPVTVESAGEKTGTGTLTLPPTVQSGVNAAVSIAGETVAAVLNNGAASVSLGDGAISGDIQADVQDASLGAFVLQQNIALPPNADSALALVRSTFPGIAGLPFEWQQRAQNAPSGAGKLLLPTPPGGSPRPAGNRTEFIFTASTRQNELDVHNGQAKMVAISAVVGILPGVGGSVEVFAVVGKGSLAGAVKSE